MVKGTKISKKKLQEPDEFITVTQRTLEFARVHIRKIGTAGLIIAVIVVAVLFFRMWKERKEADASQKLSAAMEVYQKVSSPYREGTPSDYKNALGSFEDIIKQFPNTSAGKLSLIFKGNIQFKLGEYDEAIKVYQAFLEKGGKEKLYRLFALEGLGYACEGKKDYGKAVDAYQQIVASGETSQLGDAYLSLGRCYEKLEKNKEAVESYRAYLKTNPNSDKSNMVLRKISLLEK